MIGIKKKRRGKDLVKDYAPFFSDEWHLKGTQFWRQVGDWIETINLSLRDLSICYIFEHSFIFLCEDSEFQLDGGFCVEELRSPLFFQRHDPLRLTRGAQWFVDVKDHDRILKEVFSEMNKSFRPGVFTEFDDQDMMRLISSIYSTLPMHGRYAEIMGILGLIHRDEKIAYEAFDRLKEINSELTDDVRKSYLPDEPWQVLSYRRMKFYLELYNENHNKFLEEMARIRSANIKKLNWPGLLK